MARLAGLDGVRYLPANEVDAIAQAERGGRPLAEMLALGPLEVPALLDLASNLANTLAAVHRCGVLHQNITPEHILLQGADRPPRLVDFHLATTFAQEQPGFTHHREIRGNLTYLAPEQTGRTGRSVDLRADLYALGATLYEAATGHPPFEARDPLELLHDHLARIPVSPMQIRADLPAPVSQIILRLLEKEPERRYQSAEGLAHDLAQVRQALAHEGATPPRLGEHDFPLHLSAPARLVGRDTEIDALRLAMEGAVEGRSRVVLVSGAAGVGKTSLINELRPMVTALRGWLVSGKFDQYRHDAPTAPAQALRALGRLLLAEPEAELSFQRGRILRALGPNAGLMCNGPEFALLLGSQPEVPPAEPRQAEARLLATTVDMLRAVASPERPVVMVLDDLQWAGSLSVRFIESILDAQNLPGFLLVGSYRDREVDEAHPLAAAMLRWNRQVQAPLQLSLANLPPQVMSELLREMMRLAPDQATALAQAVSQHTAGNPYDTVELLNALRRDGALRPGSGGWEWDAAKLRRYVGQSNVLDLLVTRVARLSSRSRTLMQVMACLGGQMRRSLLCAATGLLAGELDEHLMEPLEDGLLVIEPGDDSSLRMRHDRVQQAVYGTLAPGELRALHLNIARRLAVIPEFRAEAVQQYLPALDEISQPAECASVACLLREVANHTRKAANYANTERLLAAALSLLSRLPAPGAQDESLRAGLEIDHHIALCGLGRFQEADALYRVIEQRGAEVEDWVDAACAQVGSLHLRSREREAVTLGLSLLRQVGLRVPHDFAAVDIEQQLADLGEWIKHIDLGQDLRPYSGDRRSIVAARLIRRVVYPAYFCDIRIDAWLVLQAHVLWVTHGPSPELVPVLSSLGALATLKQDYYRTAYDFSRHHLAVGEARGWEPSAYEARFLIANHTTHWFEPLEHGIRLLHSAREDMLRSGELQNACFTYRPLTTAMLDCAPTLQEWGGQVESGLALALRVRHEYIIAMMSIEGQLLRSLRGLPEPADHLADDAKACLQRQLSVPAVSLSLHFCRAYLAAVFGDMPALVKHAAIVMEYAPLVPSSYRMAQTRLVQALALAQRFRSAEQGEREGLLAELDAICEWLAQRGADSPENYLHMSKWVMAERAWALDDFRLAGSMFDAALSRVESLSRPWHHAMIAERAGLFFLEQDMSKPGRQFIVQARNLYAAWGSEAKVRQLESVHGFLTAISCPVSQADSAASAAGADVPVDNIDALAILRASQALSSETSLARLKTRVADVMGALTGATSVQFALWDEDLKDWFLSEIGVQWKPIAMAEAGARRLLPLSAFRYAERTREPVLVEDVMRDDRFARDPYFAGLGRCSLLVVPILNHGRPRAMLLLENRLSSGAFTTGRLDAVSLIAGQLAVSLENALLYERLEQRVSEQTRELVAAARRAGMAQIASNVLHNVGNLLTSVNVSTQVIAQKVTNSRIRRVGDLAKLIEDDAGEPGRFLSTIDNRTTVRNYMSQLAVALHDEREELLAELMSLGDSVDRIKNVVAMQQSYAGPSGVLERCSLTELVNDALKLHEDVLTRLSVSVSRDYAQVKRIPLDKIRIMQILANLIENAWQAMAGIPSPRELHIAVAEAPGGLVVTIRDTGCGIPPEHMPRIFSHGFTTKPDGDGFGLHGCAVAAHEMAGLLRAYSDGPSRGATFTLCLPDASVSS